jgi:hypothetical protein
MRKTMGSKFIPYRIVVAATAVLAISTVLFAQEEPRGNPVSFGGFENHGEATAGYRFTDVSGYRPQFQQMFNLRDGFRVHDLSLYGDAQDRKGAFADRYTFTASGIGGDPFPSAKLMVSKTGLYEFRADWRQSYYYWNQNDDIALPISAIAPTFPRGLTTNHDWATVRKFGSAELTLHATRNLQFTFEAAHTSNDGNVFTTRTIDFFNSPAYWGGFARSNPYYLLAPLQDSTNRVAGGIDYTWRSWSLHYKAGYKTFNENVTFDEIVPNQISINPVPLSATEPLANLSWSQSRRLTTPISEFSYVGKLTSRLQWRGSYIFNRYSGPAASNEAENGIAPDSAGVLAPYTITESGRAQVVQPSHAVTQGFTYEIRNWWDVDVDYRYLRYASESVSKLESLLNGTTPSTGEDEIIWRNGLHDLSVAMDFRPMKNLAIHPGIRLLKSDIESLDNGISDPARTQRTNMVRPEIGFSYKPSSTLNIRGDFRSFNNSASYTAITPHTGISGRLLVRYHPIEQVSIENSTNTSNSKLIDTNYNNKVRANSTTVSYSWSEKLSTFGGFTYDSFLATGDVVFLRGPAPLNNPLRDQAINRVWSGGLEIKPIHHVGLRATGNYDRTTGVGQIGTEPPAYGPLVFPMITGTVYFEIPKAGRLSIDLQRTYYAEELVPANNFSANLLTIRWTRRF